MLIVVLEYGSIIVDCLGEYDLGWGDLVKNNV